MSKNTRLSRIFKRKCKIICKKEGNSKNQGSGSGNTKTIVHLAEILRMFWNWLTKK